MRGRACAGIGALLVWLCGSGVVIGQDWAVPPEAGAAVASDVADDPPFLEDAPAPTFGPLQPAPGPPMPEIPETTVVGQPSPFPATPLGDDTVLAPTRTETLAGRTGSSLTVVTRQQIVDSRHTEVSEVLRGVPGLDVVQQGGPGGVTSVFMRGANSNHTKVLIDGIPVNDPSSAGRAFNFSLLSVDNIERIEVLRGPQSTLYGSDAIGGVINVITRRGEGPLSFEAELMGGSYGTSRKAIGASGGTDEYHYSFGASYLRNDGFTQAARRLGNTERDGLRDANFSGRFGWTPSENFDVDYVFRYIDQDADIDDVDFFTGPVDAFDRQVRTDAFFNRLQTRLVLLDGFWEQKAGFALSDYQRLDTDPGFFDPQFVGQSRTFDYQNNFRLGENHVLTAGFDYLDESGGIFALSERTQYQTGIYLQDHVELAERWFLTAGFRWDDHSSAGSAETYRVTARHLLPGRATALHGSIGTGFRAPSLEERFNNWVGNPDLRPETSFGWDCGVERSFFGDRLVVDATYFRNDFTNLIQFFPTGPFTGELRNVGSAFSSGVEVTTTWRLDPRTTLAANYVYTFTRDRETGLELQRRPRHKAAFRLTRQLWCDRARLHANLLYVGQRRDSVFTLNEYVRLDLAGTYQLSRGCELFARIDNVLDENYEEVWGYETAGISAYGGVNLRW